MKFEFSAGGIVFKKIYHVIPAKAGIDSPFQGNDKVKTPGNPPSGGGDDVLILVAQHSQHHGWVFPKGLIGDKDEFKNQSKEETALREVEEETGVKGKIVEPLTPITYWYQMDGIKRKKTVYYYIMSYVNGDISKHDWEMENVEWLPIEKVEERLTYESDKKVWEEARKMILTKVVS